MGPQRKVNGISLISRDEGPSKQELSLAWGSPSLDVVEDILSLVKLKQTDGAEGSVNITTDRIRNAMLGKVVKRKFLVCIASVLTKGALKCVVQTRSFCLILPHQLVGPGDLTKTLNRVRTPSRIYAKKGDLLV